MMVKITGLTRSLLSLAKASEKDQKEPRDRTPDHPRESSLRMNCFKDFPGNLGEDGLQEDQEVLVEGT